MSSNESILAEMSQNEGAAPLTWVVKASPLRLNIYYKEPPNYMVLCIPQMLFNLSKTFNSDP